MEFDYILIGGGILGLTTAYRLQQQDPAKSILILEQESELAAHQTGRNSGVIHAGVYYQPGSKKAEFCRLGNQATIAFCQQHGIPYNQCGKLVVATNDKEHQALLSLFQRAQQNQLDVSLLSAQELSEAEPNITGVSAINVPTTGIVSYKAICIKLAALLQENGATLKTNCKVLDLKEESLAVTVDTDQGEFKAKQLIACPGIQADRFARMLGLSVDFQMVPFKGEYFKLPAKHNGIINKLIYPVPDPEMPFLGVHLTRMIDGSVTVGPNAVLAGSRYGYNRTQICPKEMFQTLTYPGFRKLMLKNLGSGLAELKSSLSKSSYLQLVNKYCPELTKADLLPYPPGIRAQAVAPDGSLIEDFLFAQSQRALVVCNAPSPAATSAFPIAEHILNQCKLKS